MVKFFILSISFNVYIKFSFFFKSVFDDFKMWVTCVSSFSLPFYSLDF